MTERLGFKGYPDELIIFSDEPNVIEFDEFFSQDEQLMEFRDCDNGVEKLELIDDPDKRWKATVDFANKHNAQIYTQVDGDDGEMYYSKGVRFCNRINMGLYVVVKVDGWEVDNS